MKVLELFAGSRCIGKAAEELGMTPFSVDWTAYENIDLVKDIEELKISDIPFVPDVIWNSPDCFTAGSLVKTSDGYVEIEKIKIGDYVLTHNNVYKKVINIMSKDVDILRRIKISGSEPLYVTENHPFLCREKFKKWKESIRSYETILTNPKWVLAKDLNKNHRVQVLVNKNSKIPIWNGVKSRIKTQIKESNGVNKNIMKLLLENGDFWWIVGRYLGDGWYRFDEKKCRYDVGICCNKNEVNEISSVLDRIKVLNYSIAEKITTMVFTISTKEFAFFISHFGKGSIGKFIPEFVLDLPKQLLKDFVDGYISADGHERIMKNDNVNYAISTISRNLAYGISQCIFKAYGRQSSIVKGLNKERNVILGRKVNVKDSYIISFYKDKNRNYYTQDELGDFWVNVKENEITKRNDIVYNISVEDDETYTVNNFTVHNCTSYTIAAIGYHRNGTEPKTEYAVKCDNTNQHFISLIKEWLVLNPNLVFFIENPRGMMRKMKWMQEFKRYTVWYCTYGDDRAKPTDIWTNSKTWIPRPECHNGNKLCHHQPAPRGSRTGTQGKKGSYDRSKIPHELCIEVLQSTLVKSEQIEFFEL